MLNGLSREYQCAGCDFAVSFLLGRIDNPKSELDVFSFSWFLLRKVPSNRSCLVLGTFANLPWLQRMLLGLWSFPAWNWHATTSKRNGRMNLFTSWWTSQETHWSSKSISAFSTRKSAKMSACRNFSSRKSPDREAFPWKKCMSYSQREKCHQSSKGKWTSTTNSENSKSSKFKTMWLIGGLHEYERSAKRKNKFKSKTVFCSESFEMKWVELFSWF